MNHNKYNFKPGDTAILDKGTEFENQVIIIALTENRLLSKVKEAVLSEDFPEDWLTMTSRLSPMEEKK